ncbi:hypothetical protein ACLOJK_035020 [Asimina triloba]
MCSNNASVQPGSNPMGSSRSTQQQQAAVQLKSFSTVATSTTASRSRDVQPQIQWLTTVIREPHLSQLQLHVIEEAIKGVAEKQNKEGRKGGSGNSFVGRLNKAFEPTGLVIRCLGKSVGVGSCGREKEGCGSKVGCGQRRTGGSEGWLCLGWKLWERERGLR